jgi:tetratricopeptide (TPR) repeat protein
MRIFFIKSIPAATFWGSRHSRACAARVLLAAMLPMLGILVPGHADSQESTMVTPQQLMNWCQGLGDTTADQMITGCTVMIEAGRSSDRNKSIAYINRGEAHRSKGDLDQGLQDFEAAIKVDPSNDRAYANRGVSHFMQADFAAASADLKQALALKHDAYSVLWQFLARERAGGGGDAGDLAGNAGPLNKTEWPYPVIELYLGKRSAGDMVAAAGNPDDRCEAQFYLGQWYLLRGERNEAVTAFRTASETCPVRFYEYAGAVAELKRLNQ